MEKREILSHIKIFRQINSLVTYLVKPLFSRNFCQISTLWQHCGNYGILLPQFFRIVCVQFTVEITEFYLTQFWEKFRENNGFTK